MCFRNKVLNIFIRNFASKSSYLKPEITPKSSTIWRNQVEQRQLITQISSILIQRHNFPPILQTLNLNSKLTPYIFHRIISNIQSNPLISLNFYNWVDSNFAKFQPDFETQCKLIQISIGSGIESRPVKCLLESMIENNPPALLANYMINVCKGTNLHDLIFSEMIKNYAFKGLYLKGLEFYKEIKLFGCLPNVVCLNVMLDVLDNASEFNLAYCLFGSMLRNRVLVNDDTLSVVARILSKSGKFECVVRLLQCGVCRAFTVFELVVDGCSKVGDFKGAFDCLDEMCKAGFEAGFCSYGSILNGACELGDVGVRERVMCVMMEKGLIPKDTVLGYDDVVVKLCGLGKVYAAECVFKRARDAGVVLKDTTFGSMLSGFSRGGRVDEAIGLYRVILKGGIVLDVSCYQELADCLCTGKAVEDTFILLMHLFKKGIYPSVSNIFEFMKNLWRKRRLKDVEALMNVMLQVKLLPDSTCCRSLVDHYCSSRKVDSALLLHDKLGISEDFWNATAYNVLLKALFREKRIDEAIDIFECMKRKNVVDGSNCSVMIFGLAQKKEMRKAMEVHDYMLKSGLKPGKTKYKSLLSVFG